MILYICFPLNSTVWLFPPRDFVIQPELLKLQVPVLLMLNLCKISLRLISSPAFIALSWAGALWYSRFQWFRPNHWNLWSQAPEPQDSREFISFNGAKRFWAWYFNAPRRKQDRMISAEVLTCQVRRLFGADFGDFGGLSIPELI